MTLINQVEKNDKRANKLIIQIGRLDFNYRSSIEFGFEKYKGNAELSSTFLQSTEPFKPSNRMIIFPVSIIFQDNLLKVENDEFIEKIKNITIQNYLNNPYEILNQHPHVKNDEVMIVTSFGNYQFKGETFQLPGSLDTISVQIFLKLIEKFAYNELEEVYFDISSGQNIYLTATFNALYRFLPFVQFMRFFNKDNEKLDGYILSSDPILGKPSHTINIQKTKFSAKAFNSVPYKDGNKISGIVKKVFKGAEDENLKNALLAFIMEDYFLLHGSFINGTPLLISLANKENLVVLFEKEGVYSIIKKLRSFYFSSFNSKELMKFSSDDIFAFAFALGIGNSIFLKFKDIINSREMVFFLDEKEDKTYSLNNEPLDNAFLILKKNYGQPEPNYKSELKKEFVDPYLKGNFNNSEFISGSRLKQLSNPDYKINSEFNPRNFFAHGGLELNITEIKINNDRVVVRYNPELGFSSRSSIIKYIKK